MACAPSEDSDQPGHPPSQIRIFAVRMKKAWVLSYPHSEDSVLTGRMPRLIWVFAGCTVILFVLSWGGSYYVCEKLTLCRDCTGVVRLCDKYSFSHTLAQMSRIMRKPVFGVCDQLRNMFAQTARMRRLICAFVVRIWHKHVFSWRGSIILYALLTDSKHRTQQAQDKQNLKNQ